MSEALINWFMVTLGGKVGKEFILFLISMVPILELRGGLLAAGPAFLNVELAKAVPICVIGNLVPIPFILLLITKIFDWMKGTKRLKPMVEKLEKKAMSKSDKIEKYEFWGLVLFVGIPLPGTGAWTGSLIAALLGIRFRKAFPAVVVGVCLAAFIMSVISYGIIGGIFGSDKYAKEVILRLLKDNEEKRNIAWRTVMTVTSVLIILIVVFFAVKLFTSNPLTGNWENTDDGMKLTIKNNGTMNIVQTLDESTVSVPVDYTIDMEYKRFAIHVNEEKIAKQAEKTKDCSEQELQDIADVMEGTYEYSVEQNVLTLTDSEYGSQKTFEKSGK